MNNVFFVGKAGAGKTFSANYLIEKYDYILAKFAYPVYMIAEKYFGMIKKERRLLQIIGTEGGRGIDKEIWIKRLFQDIEIVKKVREMEGLSEPYFVLDDCRFENEARVLIDKGWIGIYLDCPDEIRYERLNIRDGYDQRKFANHSSESSIDNFKDLLYYVDASGSLDDMYWQIDNILGGGL